jgi:hypothetical protein
MSSVIRGQWSEISAKYPQLRDFNKGGMWIGGKWTINGTQSKPSDFHWIDGKQPSYYGNWDGQTYPAHVTGIENCVQMEAPSFKWRNVACAVNLPYWSCTIEKGVVPPSLESADVDEPIKRRQANVYLSAS